MMKKIMLLLLVVMTMSMTSAAYARGGQSADDCPPGNKDPDCATH